MAGVQDDDIAFGADQLLFQVQAIMAAPELTVWLSPNDMSSIFGDINKAGSALRAYRDKFGMTERRARSPEAMNSVRDLKVKLASVAATAGVMTLGVGAAESGGFAAGLVRALAGAGVGAFAWAAFFSQLDDTPSKYRDYGVNQVRANLTNAITDLTRDFSDLQALSSMVTTAEEAQNATDDELLKALVNAIKATASVSAKLAMIGLIIAELERRYGQCLSIISKLKDKVLLINRLRWNPASFQGSFSALPKALTKALEELGDLMKDMRECIKQNPRK